MYSKQHFFSQNKCISLNHSTVLSDDIKNRHNSEKT